MPLNLKSATATVAISAAAFVAQSANAASFYVDNVTSTWTNVVGGTCVSAGTDSTPSRTSPTDATVPSGDVPASLRWGECTGDGQSGYDFNANFPSGPWDDGLVLLGDFNHINREIGSGTSITAADLVFTFDVDDVYPLGGTALSKSLTVSFIHNETSNSAGHCPTGSVSVCDDIVMATMPVGADSFQLGNTIYTFSILGFSTDDGATFVNDFLTREGGENPAQLYATVATSEIPLPAAGWLLLAGVGGLAAAGRRPKTA